MKFIDKCLFVFQGEPGPQGPPGPSGEDGERVRYLFLTLFFFSTPLPLSPSFLPQSIYLSIAATFLPLMSFSMCQGDDGEVGPRGLPGESVSSNSNTHTHTQTLYKRQTKRRKYYSILNLIYYDGLIDYDGNPVNCIEVETAERWSLLSFKPVCSRAER